MRIFQNPNNQDYRSKFVRISLKPDPSGYYRVYLPTPTGNCSAPEATVGCLASELPQRLAQLAGSSTVPLHRYVGTP